MARKYRPSVAVKRKVTFYGRIHGADQARQLYDLCDQRNSLSANCQMRRVVQGSSLRILDCPA